MNNNIVWIIGTLISVVFLLLGIMGYYYTKNRNAKKDMDTKITKAELSATEKTQMLNKMQNISDNLSALTLSVSSKMAILENKSEERDAISVKQGERIVVCEQSTSSSHKRIDEHSILFKEIRQILAEIQKNMRGK